MNKTRRFPFIRHVYATENQSTGKTIIIFHGWGSSVKKYEEFARSLSLRGFQVVIPEIPYHDSRSKLENHFTKENTQAYFWKTIFQSIDEAEDLISELGIPKKDVILLGVSMGGFIATGIFANVPGFAGLININGSGSFLLSEKIFRETDNRPALSVSETQLFNAYDPIRKEKSPFPILLMHGEQDAVVSIKGQEDYYASLTCGSAGNKIAYFKYKNINHTISEEMTEDLLRWLGENF